MESPPKKAFVPSALSTHPFLFPACLGFSLALAASIRSNRRMWERVGCPSIAHPGERVQCNGKVPETGIRRSSVQS